MMTEIMARASSATCYDGNALYSLGDVVVSSKIDSDSPSECVAKVSVSCGMSLMSRRVEAFRDFLFGVLTRTLNMISQ